MLPLDDCLYVLQPSLPHLTRSSLHRCLRRHGISRLPEVGGTDPASAKFKTYPIGFLHIDIAEVRTGDGKLYRFDRLCRKHGIEHSLTKPARPWTAARSNA